MVKVANWNKTVSRGKLVGVLKKSPPDVVCLRQDPAVGYLRGYLLQHRGTNVVIFGGQIYRGERGTRCSKTDKKQQKQEATGLL